MREQRNADSEMKRKELELKERELALRERELSIGRPNETAPAPEVITGVTVEAPYTTATDNPVETSTIVTTTESAGAITTDTAQPEAYANAYRCGRAKKDGEICGTFVASEGEACRHHQ